MLVAVNILFAILNTVMAFRHYEKGNYKSAMWSMFFAGFLYCVTLYLMLMVSCN
jgi:hypothetical protein